MSYHGLMTRLLPWRFGYLAKGTLAMTVGMALRTLVQVAVFVIVARVLGVANYGAFAAVLALASALGSFTDLGTGILMMRDISRDPKSFNAAWGRTLTAIGISAPVLFVVYLLFAWALLPVGISSLAIICIGLAEIVLVPIGYGAIKAYQGYERIGRASRLVLVPVLPRLVCALIFVPFTYVLPLYQRLNVWAFLYSVAALIAAVYAWRLLHRDLVFSDKINWSGVWTGMRESLPFAFGGVALRLYTDIDKTMLARLATFSAAGAYSAGYRMVDMAAIPINAMLATSIPRFFRIAETGQANVTAYALRILPLPLAYSLCVGLLMYFGAEFLPLLLGVNYVCAVPALQWLAWLPIATSPRLFLQTVLATSGHQDLAVVIIMMGAGVNIGLNMWVIPRWTWQGAVFATYVAEIFMTTVMIAAVWSDRVFDFKCALKKGLQR